MLGRFVALYVRADFIRCPCRTESATRDGEPQTSGRRRRSSWVFGGRGRSPSRVAAEPTAPAFDGVPSTRGALSSDARVISVSGLLQALLETSEGGGAKSKKKKPSESSNATNPLHEQLALLMLLRLVKLAAPEYPGDGPSKPAMQKKAKAKVKELTDGQSDYRVI